MFPKTEQAAELECKGYLAWLQTLGRRTFSKPFASFHFEFWDWYWPVRFKLLRGEVLTPEEMTMLLIWGRGMGKSSHVEWACIAEGALGEGVTDEPGFVGYVCDTEALAKGHIQSIRNRLDSPQVAYYYPGLSNPRVDKHGYQTAWRQDFLATSSHWGIIPIGLEEGVRGGRLFDLRFTMFVFDDIDSRKDSPAAVEKKMKIISHEILPAGTPDTLKLVPQNLIHENGFVTQVYTRRSDILSERQESGPYPAFDDLELELDSSSAGRKWKIKSARPTWPSIDLRAASVFLADSGKVAFLAEYQHDLESNKEGRVLRNYNDKLMVIRRSDFQRVYGQRFIPKNWPKRVFHDWSRTKSAYHANIAGKLTVSNQNTKLPGKLFLFDLMSFEEQTQADDVGKRLLESITPFVPGTNQTWAQLIDSSTSRAGLEIYLSDLTRLIEARRNVLAGVIPPLVVPLLQENGYTSFVGSHDQNNDALTVYRKVFGLPFAPVNPGESGGLEWIDHFMLVDKKTRHPFFEDEQLEDGTWKLGCPGMFILLEDEKYPYPQVSTPDALHDSDLCRYQFNNWRMRPAKLTEGGLVEHGPMKMNDDFGQGLQMAMVNGPPAPLPLTFGEKVVEATPPSKRFEALQEQSNIPGGGLTPEAEMTFIYNRKQAEKKIRPRIVETNEWGEEI
ncbi:MAG TPA: hypothetical protein VN256_13105 [Pyrinomonadaceae bacterium]|nr:hypothetical protein [Pyrinomonadaceae bacterium]